MMHLNDQSGSGKLDRAIAALRDAPMPDGPPPQLLAATMEALSSAKKPPNVLRCSERKKKMFIFMRYSSIAAAVLLGGLAGWLVLLDRTAPQAFANVVENVSNAKSVTFVLKSELGSQPTILQKFYMQGTAYRMEMPSSGQGFPVPDGAPPVLMALIADAGERQALELDFVAQTAQKREVDDEQWEEMARTDIIEQFRKLTAKDAERIDDDKLHGRTTHVYQLKRIDFFGGKGLVDEGETAKVWVDPELGLPVRIELVSLSADRKHKSRMIFKQFAWNQPLDPDLFELEAPEGFTRHDTRASEHLHALQDQVQNISRRVIPTVVAIETRGRLFGLGGGDTLGTGAIISADGLVLSQFHVTHGSVASRGPVDAPRRKPGERLVVVLHDGRKVEAEILGGVPHLDISMLRIVKSGKWAYAELAEKTEPDVGDRVLKLGHPRGYQPGRPPVVRLGRLVGREGENMGCFRFRGQSNSLNRHNGYWDSNSAGVR